jgi:pyruvate kinase
MRKAKIVATLGPATNTRDAIQALVRAGMDVVRLNFSHGTHEEHGQLIRLVREVAAAEKRYLAILQDLPGPKIRTGRLRQRRPVLLRAGATVRLTCRDIPGNSQRLSVSYPYIGRDFRRGDRILLADGLLELRVQSSEDNEAVCLVVNGGLMGEHKGVNLPGVKLRISAMTEEDERHLRFGLEQGVDYVALSFVRSAREVKAVKSLIARLGARTPVVAKLEKPEAIHDLDAILAVADAVMVARGDLGVEMPPEQVPVVQKQVIERAGAAKIPVITATQMLESMTTNPRPTRAEASDVANAIFDGTDAVMLSGETAAGKYPREAVEMMARIAAQAERHMSQRGWRRRSSREKNIAETVAETVAHATSELDVKAVVVFTRSGATARLVSKYRPLAPIYAFCHDEQVCRRAALYWGVTPRLMPLKADTDSTIAAAEKVLLSEKRVAPGGILAFVAGSPFGAPGGTNMMRLVHAGDAEGGRQKAEGGRR